MDSRLPEAFAWCALETRPDGSVAMSGRARWRGGRSVPGPDGSECGVVAGWEWRDGTLTVESDRFGYVPLYWFEGGGRCVVANNPVAAVAAGAPGEPDPEATGAWCRIGFHLGEATPFRAIRRVAADTVHRWRAGRVETTTPERPRPAPIASVAEGIEGYAERFRAAMRRRPPFARPLVLPLSGGRDSRMILLELVAMGERPDRCVTFGGPGDPDAVVAAMLCERLGIPHETIDAPADWIRDELAKHARCGLEAGEHTWMLPLWDRCRGLTDGWYDGLGVGAMTRGETCQPSFLELYRRGDLDGWADEFFRWTFSVDAATARSLADRAGWFDGRVETARAVVAREVRKRTDAPNPLTAFSFANWGRRAISLVPLAIAGDGSRIHLPFMDRELVEFVARVPVAIALENDLQTDALHLLHPSFRDVPFEKEVAKKAGATRPPRPSRWASLSAKVAAWRRIRGFGNPLARTAATAELRGERRLAAIALGLALVEHCGERTRAAAFLADAAGR